MKIEHPSNNLYLIKVSLFLSITLLACFYFIRGGHQPANSDISGSFPGLMIAGGKSIYFSGLQFILFTFSLFVANPKFNLMIESAIVIAITQTLFFLLTINGVITINNFIVEMLVAIGIAGVLVDNVYSVKIKGPRIGFSITFSIVYGIWLANQFKSNGITAAYALENLIAINAGIIIAQLSVVILAFFLFGKLLADNNRYRGFVVMPFTFVSFLATGYLLYLQFLS